jgi:nucleoside-diphosphate-sugar epimerase
VAWLAPAAPRLPAPDLERGFWLARLAGRALHHSVDLAGVAVLPGDGSARHAFIASDELAEAVVAAALHDGELPRELRLGGPEPLTWREAAQGLGRALALRIRTLHQPATLNRALALLTRTVSPAAAQIFASQAIVATVDSAYSPEETRRLLGRQPISVEAYLRRMSGREIAMEQAAHE